MSGPWIMLVASTGGGCDAFGPFEDVAQARQDRKAAGLNAIVLELHAPMSALSPKQPKTEPKPGSDLRTGTTYCPLCESTPLAPHDRWCSECGYDTHLHLSHAEVQDSYRVLEKRLASTQQTISELEAKLASTQRALDESRAGRKHAFGMWEVRYRHLHEDNSTTQPLTMVVETDNPWHAVAVVKDHLHGTQEKYAFDDVKRRGS